MVRRLSAALAGLVWGCAWLGIGPDARLADARAAVERHEYALAYDELCELRTRDPESPAAARAFPLAASLFKHEYQGRRIAEPTSAWMRSRPAFMLDWLASFCRERAFPTEQARALFVGMPYGYFRDFVALTESRPELAGCKGTAQEDDGVIESVAAATPGSG